MATRKKAASDPHFMPNLEAAIRAEMRKGAAPPALPAPKAAVLKGGDGEPEERPRRGRRSDGETLSKSEPPADRDALLKELRGLLPRLDA